MQFKHPLPPTVIEWLRHPPRGEGLVVQTALIALLKPWLQEQRDEIRRRFFQKRQGVATGQELARLMDDLLRQLLAATGADAIPGFTIIATGGYGRRMLAPHSDIDLLFLHDTQNLAHITPVIEVVLYLLWDLGLKIGQATRSQEEAIQLARSDLSCFTSLLDARWLAGDEALFGRFLEQFRKKALQGQETQFIRRRLEERDQRHNSCGDSRYILEPNVKEGKGGLRDLQTLWWIAQVACNLEDMADLRRRDVFTEWEYRRYRLAREFLWKTRIGMHYLSNNATNRLTFDLQRELSAALLYHDRPGLLAVERFMKHYFLAARTIGNLTRSLCTTLERQHIHKRAFSALPSLLRRKRSIAGLPLEGSRLMVPSAGWLKEKPSRMLQVFAVAQEHDLDLHPEALQIITHHLSLVDESLRQDAEANRLFLTMLTHPKQPGNTLRRLSESGVLGRFLPDFGRIVGMMQFDMYHVFTVDEHTIQAISTLNSIEQGMLKDELPLASDVIHRIQLRSSLFLGLLLHDIAKGRGGNHSELGEKIALKLGKRLGLSAAETETAAWLVRHHLIFSDTAFRRDLSDPGTIRQFVDHVQSPERLKLLLLLTVADIRAVGPSVWNSWKGTLMRELYNQAAEAMGGGGFQADRMTRMQTVKAALAQEITDWPEAEREQYLRSTNASFWLGMPLEEHRHIARLIHRTKAGADPFALTFHTAPKQDVTRLTLCTLTHHGLLMQVTGACAASSVAVVNAKSLTSTLGYSILQLDIQTGQREPLTDPDRQHQLQEQIRAAIGSPLNTRLFTPRPSPFRKSSHVFRVEPHVFIDNTTSRHHTILEVNARDRLGLLYTMVRILTLQGVMIATAHISTYGEKAIDVFYIKDMLGTKITSEERLDKLRQALLQALAEHEQAKHAA